MSLSMQYFLALEVARERTREAEARARLRWGMEPEPPVGRRAAARFANFCRGVTEPATESRCARLEKALTRQASGPSPA